MVESNGEAFHGDGAALLLNEGVHVAEAAGELGVDDAAVGAGDEVVAEGGLAVVHMGQDANVLELLGIGSVGSSLWFKFVKGWN